MSQPPEQTPAQRPGVIGRAKAAFARYRDDHRWFAHVLDAYALMGRNHANEYAAAITYFSFLALFPLILLAVSVTGFVLSSHAGLEHEFFSAITRKVPGQFGSTLKTSIQSAIDARAGVGIVGVLGVVLAGGAWIGNLREAIDAVWGHQPVKRNVVLARVANLGVLAGLGIALLVSVGLTAVGTSLTDQLLSAVGLADLPGAHVVLKILGIAIAVGADMVVFWWILVRLPQQDVPGSVAVRGALLAAAGFEVLKVVGTVTIAHTAKSPTAGPFAGLLAVLIWIQLVARFMLFVCAWMATARPAPPPAPEAAVELVEVVAVPPRTRAALFGLGAAAGSLAAWVLSGSRAGRRRPS